jgi:hypothetical protein
MSTMDKISVYSTVMSSPDLNTKDSGLMRRVVARSRTRANQASLLQRTTIADLSGVKSILQPPPVYDKFGEPFQGRRITDQGR